MERVSLPGMIASYSRNEPEAGVAADPARPTRTVTADDDSLAIIRLEIIAVVVPSGHTIFRFTSAEEVNRADEFTDTPTRPDGFAGRAITAKRIVFSPY